MQDLFALFTVLAVIPIGANVYASSGEDYITGRQEDIGGPGHSVTVDIGSNHTSRTSPNLNARRKSLNATNSRLSSGSLSAQAQYRTGTIATSWHTDVSRTIPVGGADFGYSHRFNTIQTWRLRLARVNDNRFVTASGRLSTI